MERTSGNVKKAITLAKAASDRREQEFQKQERRFAAQHRKQLSIFVSRSQKEFEKLEILKELQMRRDRDLLSKFLVSPIKLALMRVVEKKKSLLDSLSTYPYEKNFRQTRKKRHINTAMWLFSTPEFINWKESDLSSVFFLTGKRKFTVLFRDYTNSAVVGSGKTILAQVLSSFIFCLLTQSSDRVLLTIFIAKKQDLTAILRLFFPALMISCHSAL